MKTYKRLGIKVDVRGLAAGLKEIFTHSERNVLRFGMLPAKKIELFEKQLREKMIETFTNEPIDTSAKLVKSRALYRDPDWKDGDPYFEEIEFTIDEIVSEITRDVTLEIYRNGDLVV